MTLIQMQYFQAVCRFENFTKAANFLHISQPAMSAAMRELERECGVPLFIRDKNALRVTEEGKVLLHEAEAILGQYDQLQHIVNDLALARTYVRVGLSTLSGNQVYPEILRAYQKQFPEIQVVSVEDSTKRQFELLDGGLLDLVITIRRHRTEAEQKAFDAMYGHYPIRKTRLLFCVGQESSLAARSFVTVAEMAKEPLVLLMDHFNQTQKLKRMFEENHQSYHVVHYTNQMYTVERFIEKNAAAGFLPEEVVRENPRITGIPYESGTEGMIEVFWRKDKYMYPSARKLLDVIKELYPKERKNGTKIAGN